MKNFVFYSLQKSFGLIIFSLFCLNTFNLVYAQDEFERVEVLDHPRFSLNNRVVVDTEFSWLPLDAYYKPIVFELAGSYQFSNWFSWEIVRLGMSINNYDTKLNDQVASLVNSEIERVSPGAEQFTGTTSDDLKEFKYKVGSALFTNLLYSKSNFFNQAVVYHYWQAGAGMTYFDLDQEKQYTADLILRARFFISEHLVLNLRGGYSYGFNSKAPASIFFLGGGAGYAF